MLVKSYAAAVQGISATVVTVEVNCSKGIQFFLVGLPDVAVRESHERIISALQVCGYKSPAIVSLLIWPPQISVRKGPLMICLWRSVFWRRQSR